MTLAAWETAAKNKRDQLAKEIAATGYPVPASVEKDNVTDLDLSNYLTARQIEITELGPETLVQRLAAKTYTAVEVTEAFCRRAVIAHALINCLNLIFFERALARAKQLDEILESTCKVVGPLHGLPISLKNLFDIEGIEMNFVYVGWIDRIAPTSSDIVKILEQQGAVLYVYTNLPQATLSGGSLNNLYGRTANPHNRKMDSGGSSAGEAGLLAMKGSPLGVGSDLGGSIRMPSAFNGLYGFKGTWRRIPARGCTDVQLGQEVVTNVIGPLSPTLEGCKLFFKAVIDAKPWLLDPLVMRMPWDEAAYQLRDHGEGKTPLCFGLQWDNGIVKPNPPYIRAMQMVKDALIRQGHKVVDWKFPYAAEGAAIFELVPWCDGGLDVKDNCALSGEPFLYEADEGKEIKHFTVREYHQHVHECRTLAGRVLHEWQRTASLTGTGRPLDAVITPVGPYPSFRPGVDDDKEYQDYTGVSNINNFPSCTFPVTQVQPAVDGQVAPHEFMSAEDKEIYERYDPNVCKDIPIGLQLIGQSGEDEAVLRMTAIVADALAAEP